MATKSRDSVESRPSKRPRAYSYLRFSTPEQQRGDSFRRQSESAQRYADQHDLDLDQDLTFQDLGVSAFRGRNVVEGSLGAFLRAVDEGRVPRGSFLLVESLDRLSRDRLMAALGLFQSLLDRGITVVTLSDGKTFTKESLNNLSDLMWFLMVASRAHEESLTKSHRGKASWKAKRTRAATDGTPLTAMVPAWLRMDPKTGDLQVIEDRAKVVQRIFAMYFDGYGKTGIARRFNEEGVPTFSDRSDGWHHSYIEKILVNEAVIGSFQPMREVEPSEGSSRGAKRRVPDGDPIDDYFPAVIDEVTFARSRQVRRSKRRISGPKGVGFSNLLSGLATCGYCGATMHRVNKGKPPKGKVYLACSRARRRVNGCNAPSVRYEPVVLALLNSLTAGDLGLARVLELGDDGVGNGRRVAIREQIEAVKGSLTETAEAIEKVLVGIERAKNEQVTDTLLARLEDQQERKTALEEQRSLLEDQIAELDHEASSRQSAVEDAFRLVREWNARLEKADDDPSLLYDMNLRLNSALRQVVEGVAVGVSESAKEWIEGELISWRLKRGPMFPHPVFEAKYDEVMSCASNGGKGLSMTATFRGHEGRYLAVYGDAKVPGRFIGVSVVIDPLGGNVQGVELTISDCLPSAPVRQI